MVAPDIVEMRTLWVARLRDPTADLEWADQLLHETLLVRYLKGVHLDAFTALLGLEDQPSNLDGV